MDERKLQAVSYINTVSCCSQMIGIEFPLIRTKHIKVDYHFVREKVLRCDLLIKFISTHDQLADLFTKGLPSPRFNRLTSKLMWKFPIRLRGDDSASSEVRIICSNGQFSCSKVIKYKTCLKCNGVVSHSTQRATVSFYLVSVIERLKDHARVSFCYGSCEAVTSLLNQTSLGFSLFPSLVYLYIQISIHLYRLYCIVLFVSNNI